MTSSDPTGGDLAIDRADLGRFVASLFIYSDRDTYVSLRALPIGVKIVDCPVCVSNGKAWAALLQSRSSRTASRSATSAACRPTAPNGATSACAMPSPSVSSPPLRAEYPDLFDDGGRP